MFLLILNAFLTEWYEDIRNKISNAGNIKSQYINSERRFLYTFFNGCQGRPETAEDFQEGGKEVLEASTHPSIVQSPHSETIHSSGQQIAHSALELWPVVHFWGYILGFCHLHTVLRDLTATFWGRDI